MSRLIKNRFGREVKKIRRRFAEALLAFSLVMLFSIYFSSIPIQPLPGAEYTWVAPQVLSANPLLNEDQKVTTHVTITNATHGANMSSYDSEEGIVLLIPSGSPLLSVGDSVIVRGILKHDLTLQIEVIEFYVLDASSSILRSVPGIVIFTILFFSFFKFDYRRLAFTIRGETDA